VSTYTKEQVVLYVDRVSQTLGGRQILRDVNATVANIERAETTGQVVCFLGPSGVGKTTLSRIIAGLDTPSSGHVLVNGKPTEKGIVGMVPQTYPLFEYLTVKQNFLVAGKQVGLTAAAALAKAMPFVSEFGLEKYLDTYPRKLSGGTRQRVAIVRQLLCSEHFIVLDEPFSGLDPNMKRRAATMIQRVANLDTLNTIIIVTHDVTEGMSVADTVWLMGHEPDPSNHGCYLPGARIVEEIDLAAMGLAWREGDLLAVDPDFLAITAVVKKRFATLTGPIVSIR
jgi:ABC-type nitrate/sulfonate/bicarbonate transport system ATPase subunit